MDGAIPAVVDVEASGFGRGSYPIEVGVAMPDSRTHCFLICPEPDWQHWDPDAERVHHIPRHVLYARGRPVRDVALALNDLLGGATVYSDAWGNDSAWLARLYDSAELPQRFRVEHLRRVMSEPQMMRWDASRDAVVRELGLTRHRASSDALVIQQTWLRSAVELAA